MKSFRSFFGLAALMFAAAVGLSSLTACGIGLGGSAAAASSAVAAPSTFNTQLGVGYSALKAVEAGAKVLVAKDKISKAEAQDAHDQCVQLIAALDAYKAAGEGGVSGSTLGNTLLAITVLQAYISSKGT